MAELQTWISGRREWRLSGDPARTAGERSPLEQAVAGSSVHYLPQPMSLTEAQRFLALRADLSNETEPRIFRDQQIESGTMARAAVKSRSATSRTVADAAPKRRPGRPPGVKNRVKATPAKATRTTKATAAAKAAPKRNKAELEAHVIKLERTVARLREQNKEMKRAAAAPAETPEPPAAVAKPVRRRPKKESVTPAEAES